jgi:hypothetical protein
MAGAGAKKFPAFSKLASDDVNNYLMDQTIMRFATTTARDAAFGGVGEPTLAEGMTAYIDADNSIYTYDGSNWVNMISASNPPALEFITTQAFTGVTSAAPLHVNNVFTSKYTNYKLLLENMTMSAGSVDVFFQWRAAGVTTTANYFYAYRGITSAAGSVDANSNGTQTGIIIGYATTAAGSGSAIANLMTPNATGQAAVQVQMFSQGAGFYLTRSGGGALNSGADFDGFTLTVGSGTLSGTLTLYGYRK